MGRCGAWEGVVHGKMWCIGGCLNSSTCWVIVGYLKTQQLSAYLCEDHPSRCLLILISKLKFVLLTIVCFILVFLSFFFFFDSKN